MTLTDLVSNLLRKPVVIGKKLMPESEKKDLLKEEAKKAVDRLNALYDFPFNRGEATFTTSGSVVDYTLKGLNSDCREVKFMNFGANKTPIEKMREADYNRKYANTVTPTTIAGWYPAGEAEGFPAITLIGTIGDGTEITYVYRKKNMGVEQWPEEWLYVLDDMTLSMAFPTETTLEAKSKRSLKEMVEKYERPAGEESPIIQSSEWTKRNIERNRKYGY